MVVGLAVGNSTAVLLRLRPVVRWSLGSNLVLVHSMGATTCFVVNAVTPGAVACLPDSPDSVVTLIVGLCMREGGKGSYPPLLLLLLVL